MPSEKPLPGKCGGLVTNWEIKYGKKMYCTNMAGKGTDHKGQGKCRKHGGSSTGRHGLTRTLKALNKLITEDEKKAFSELPDTAKYDLDNELLTIKKLLNEFQKKDTNEVLNDEKQIDSIIKIIENIRKIVETVLKIKFGDVKSYSNKQIAMNFASFMIYSYKIIREINEPAVRDRMFYQAVSEGARAAVSGIDRPDVAEGFSIGEVAESNRAKKPISYL